MTTERKYRKTLNRNGWMSKIQRFSFGGSVPRFVGYCPFFWFTWLCILLMPIILPFKVIRLLCVGFAIAIIAAIDLLPERKVSKPADWLLLDFYERFKEYDLATAIKIFQDISDRRDALIAWVSVTPDWENCAKRAVIKRDAVKVKAVAREKKVRTLSKYGAPVAKFILTVLGTSVILLALYWLQKLIIKIRWHEVWASLVYAIPYTGWILLTATIIAAGIWLIILAVTFLVNRFQRCPKCPEKVAILSKIGSGVITGFEFIGETVRSIYTRECPLIEWDDHSEPIKPRQ